MASAPRADQATALRKAATDRGLGKLPLLPAIAVTGGKGGVGKTCVAVNLSVALAQAGMRPLLVDGDLGLANADALLGVSPENTLYEVVIEGLPVHEAIISSRHGFDLLPAASGIDELTRLQGGQLRALVANLALASKSYDMLVIDTAAGIGAEVLTALASSRIVLVVVNPEPTSLTDAYALIKVLETQHPGRDVRILVNQSESDDQAHRVFQRMQAVCRKYLDRDVSFIGHLPRDRGVRDAISTRRPFVKNRDSFAGRALTAVATRLRGEDWKALPPPR